MISVEMAMLLDRHYYGTALLRYYGVWKYGHFTQMCMLFSFRDVESVCRRRARFIAMSYSNVIIIYHQHHEHHH